MWGEVKSWEGAEDEDLNNHGGGCFDLCILDVQQIYIVVLGKIY